MKILARNIDMLATFLENDKPQPVRFRIKEKGGENKIIVRVEKINFVDERKVAGKKAIVYGCQSMINGQLRQYELKYRVDDYSWELYKM